MNLTYRGLCVLERRGERVLGREPVIDRDDAAARGVRERAADPVVGVERAGHEAASVKVHDPRARHGRGERGVQAKAQCPGRPFDSELVDPLDGGKSSSQAHQLLEARAALAH